MRKLRILATLVFAAPFREQRDRLRHQFHHPADIDYIKVRTPSSSFSAEPCAPATYTPSSNPSSSPLRQLRLRTMALNSIAIRGDHVATSILRRRCGQTSTADAILRASSTSFSAPLVGETTSATKTVNANDTQTDDTTCASECGNQPSAPSADFAVSLLGIDVDGKLIVVFRRGQALGRTPWSKKSN